MSAPTPAPGDGDPTSGERAPGGRRLFFALAFATVTVGACALLGRRFTHTSWPLERAHMGLVAGAIALYFASYVLRALGWQKLFPSAGRPGRARCLAACGAAAASGAVLPFRLDYLVKIGTLRRLSGVKLGLEAIALSIISLGIVDAIAFLPLSISATATSSGSFRLPLHRSRSLRRLLLRPARRRPPAGGTPIVARRARLARLAARVVNHPRSTTREAIAAWLFLLGCWTSRALGSTLLLAALGVGFSPPLALVVLCLSAAASLIPIASGGAIANVSATAAVLLALGVHKDAGDQLRPRLGPAALRHGRRSRDRRRRSLRRDRPTGAARRPRSRLRAILRGRWRPGPPDPAWATRRLCAEQTSREIPARRASMFRSKTQAIIASDNRASWAREHEGDGIAGRPSERSRERGKNGKVQRSFAFAQAFGRADGFRSTMLFERTRANWRERLPQIDKLGVTGSSPVPPILSMSK